MIVWIVGKINKKNYLEWEFQGVFSKEQKAIDVCKNKNNTWFIAPANMDERIIEKGIAWPELYYPKTRFGK